MKASIFLSVFSFFVMSGSTSFANDIPKNMKCTETNTTFGTTFERTFDMTHQSQQSECSTCGTTDIYKVVYTSGNLPAGLEGVLTSRMIDRETAFLSSIPQEDSYFIQTCGESKKVDGVFKWMLFIGDAGPVSCLTCSEVKN